MGTGTNKTGVSTHYKANEYFSAKIGNASNEIFALFMAQVYDKIPEAILAQFSKLKFIQGSNFEKFKSYFLANYLGGFIVPANTFDNVKGTFPIGFTIWDLNDKKPINKIKCDVYDNNEKKIGKKQFYGNLPQSINKWLVNYYNHGDLINIATLSTRGNDFQNNKYIYLATKIDNNVHDTKVKISQINIIAICIYFAVRHCVGATWLNDRDQFLSPNKKWQKDKEFQTDCLTFALFHGQNRITSKDGINHWIPFTEYEVESPEKFDSNFMTQFINGKLKPSGNGDAFKKEKLTTPLEFSFEAKAVFEAGRELWKYYLSKPDCNANAALYDIREYFQGRNIKGKMNNKSEDEQYTVLMDALRNSLKTLSKKIEPKIYEYGFLIQ
jgi:hypothetical protein